MTESWLTSAFGDSNGLFSARNYILTDTNQDTSEGINTSQRDGWLTNNGNTEYYAGVAYATAEAVVLLNPSGNKITYANVAPVDATAGDLWYEVNNNYKMYRHDGNGWAVAVLNGDNITVGTIDANAVNVSNINAGNITSGTINAARINVQDIITTGNLVAVDEVNGLVTSISGNAITTGTINAIDIYGAYGNFTKAISTPWGTVTLTGDGGSSGTNVGVHGRGFVGGTFYGRFAGIMADSDDGDGVRAGSTDYSGRGLDATSTGTYGVGIESFGQYRGIEAFTNGTYGFYTTDSAYIAGTAFPFTGAHISYTQETVAKGDIISSFDAWVININQTLVHSYTTTNEKDTKVFGIVSLISSTLGDAFNNSLYSTQDISTKEWVIKEEYKPYIDYMLANNYKEVGANSVGEGGINVCASNGDILNGDYICSSNIRGKGQKQDDDLMHNYTVAKALEDVIWADQVIGEAGVFEQDGVMCKTIACTYHCG